MTHWGIPLRAFLVLCTAQVIIVYRDGVSESFYDQVLTTEFMAIKRVSVRVRWHCQEGRQLECV